jgi:type IV pilus assembly protein PilQ
LHPIKLQTCLNSETNQFVVEVENAVLPAKLKRPLNTKDMSGGIGGIDAYQNQGSTTARIVVQLRAGVPEPIIQAEGNSLLVVQTGQPMATVAENTFPGSESLVSGATVASAPEATANKLAAEEGSADSEQTLSVKSNNGSLSIGIPFPLFRSCIMDCFR